MRNQLVLALGIGLAIVARPSAAHHSFAAEFDAAKPFELTGAVTKLVWSNPHAWIYLDVIDDKTKNVTNWAVELNSPNALLRAGWTRNSLKAGDVVTIEGSLAKDGSPTGNARSVVTSTGQKLFAGSSQETTP
jgi:Family of unknown function (DUF6152)